MARVVGRWGRALTVVALGVTLSGCGGAIPLDVMLDRGESLRIHASGPATLDPALSTDSVSWSYLIQIFAGLVRLDADLRVVPDLAERWDISPDGRTYTFTIRENARFHSGRQVTADDFVYAMTRALEGATASPVASGYLGDLVGAADLAAGRTGKLAGARALDARTLQLEIDAPKSYFLAKLTFPTAFALDRANVESGQNWFERPNGAGPFRLGAWERENELRLLRFNDYWGGPARVREVVFNLSAIPGVVLYEQGVVDVADIGPADVDRVTDPRSPLRAEVVAVPLLSTWYIGMNTSRPPFDDPAVRRAFAAATDRERLSRVYFRGTRPPARSILPPGLPGHNPDIRAPGYDARAARQEIARSRYAGRMPDIVLAVGPGAGSTGEAFAEMFARTLGVDVGVREWGADYFAALDRREPAFFLTGWIADYPHPENFLDILFHSRGTANYGAFRLPELDALLEQARVESYDARRAELYEQSERLILDQAAVIPVYHEVNRALVRPYVKNLAWTPLGVLSYREVEVGQRTVRPAA